VKTIIYVLVCAALAGCPKPQPSPGPGTTASGACQTSKSVCAVNATGVSLIRAGKFWLLDLRGKNSFDAPALLSESKKCGPAGCGATLTEVQLKALATQLADAKVEKLTLKGNVTAVAYRTSAGTVVQLWLDANLDDLLPQLTVPLVGVECLPGQCELPGAPPPPFRRDALESFGP
jgi:hypothetical protein